MKLKYKDPHLHYVALTCIIHKKGKYLITKRSPHEKAFPNMWTVPGGRVNVNDYKNLPKKVDSAWYGAVENSLKREVREETDLEIDNIRYLVDMTFIRPDGIPVVILSYFADYKSGKVKLDEDAVDYSWVTPKEAKNHNLISGIYEEIVMADKLMNLPQAYARGIFSPRFIGRKIPPKRKTLRFHPQFYDCGISRRGINGVKSEK